MQSMPFRVLTLILPLLLFWSALVAQGQLAVVAMPACEVVQVSSAQSAPQDQENQAVGNPQGDYLPSPADAQGDPLALLPEGATGDLPKLQMPPPLRYEASSLPAPYLDGLLRPPCAAACFA
jgi:hypothetical protein